MFVKMSLSAALALFTLGACALPFALDFWNSAQPSNATETVASESTLEEKSIPPSSTTTSSASDRIIKPTSTQTLMLQGAVATLTAPVSEEETASRNDSASDPSYLPQIGSPVWLPNFAYPELGCNWMGVAGQVLDTDDVPIQNLIIEIGGSLEGSEVFKIGLTGLASIYGPGGYEIVLSDHGVDSSQMMWIQIHDLIGQDLSDRVYFDTFADCERNLILINFVQAKVFLIEFLPLLFNQP
jgi:hypothetical protein